MRVSLSPRTATYNESLVSLRTRTKCSILKFMGPPNSEKCQERENALAWDSGCLNDPTRNEFLIPKIVSLFKEKRPSRILDIGTGTGYIPRTIDVQLDYRPQWTLLDLNEHRIRIAEQKMPSTMNSQFHVGGVDHLGPKHPLYDAIIITFTLLEVENVGAMLRGAIGLLAENGMLIVAVPDVWRDTLEASADSHTLPRRLLTETIALPKIDKFTRAPYPFFAVRTESLISAVLTQGCALEHLEKGGCQGEAYLLVFRKNVRPEPDSCRE